MSENYAIKYKTRNLILIVNEEFSHKLGGIIKNSTGMRLALLYRIFPLIEIDSSKLVREAYMEYYGENIAESADTIFNAFIPFRSFCISRLKALYRMSGNSHYYPFEGKDIRKDLNQLIYMHIDEIFEGYDNLKKLFDELFELMYSFSNFMPVPKYFNGTKKTNGKGTYALNADYPYIYLQNLKDNNSGIYKREEMLLWLEDKLKPESKYGIKDMYELRPPYNINEYYSDDKLESLEEYLSSAIRLISTRFTS